MTCISGESLFNQDKCIADLRFKAEFFRDLRLETLDGVHISDITVPDELKAQLQKAVAPPGRRSGHKEALISRITPESR